MRMGRVNSVHDFIYDSLIIIDVGSERNLIYFLYSIWEDRNMLSRNQLVASLVSLSLSLSLPPLSL